MSVCLCVSVFVCVLPRGIVCLCMIECAYSCESMCMYMFTYVYIRIYMYIYMPLSLIFSSVSHVFLRFQFHLLFLLESPRQGYAVRTGGGIVAQRRPPIPIGSRNIYIYIYTYIYIYVCIIYIYIPCVISRSLGRSVARSLFALKS